MSRDWFWRKFVSLGPPGRSGSGTTGTPTRGNGKLRIISTPTYLASRRANTGIAHLFSEVMYSAAVLAGLAGSNGGSPEAGATTSLGTKDGDEKVLMFMDSCTQEGQGPGNVWVGDNEAVQDRAKSINRRLCDKLTKKLLEFVLRRDRWRTLAPDLVAGEGADDADAWIFDEAIELQDLFLSDHAAEEQGRSISSDDGAVEIVCFDKVVAGMGSLDLGLYRDNFLQQGYFDGFMG